MNSFWCNRTDGCDNDGVQTDMTCQPRKQGLKYCEASNECLANLGLVCYQNRSQCDCADMVNYYWSEAIKDCVPKRSFHEACIEDLECLYTQNLDCDIIAGQCECMNVTYK